MICCIACDNYIRGKMYNYWSWRTYRHQQGSLVWKSKLQHDYICWHIWVLCNFINIQYEFKVID